MNFNLVHIHERDSRVRFYPENHTYTFDDIPAESVSTIIASWFPTFDAERNAIRKSSPKHPKEQYLEEWACRGNEARAIGTFMHAQIEQFLLGQPFSDSCPYVFHGNYVNIEKEIRINQELAAFRQFIEEKKPIPYRTEWSICDEVHHIAGTIDFLTQNEAGEFIMYDWKRSNKIGMIEKEGFQICSQNSFHRHAHGLLAHIDDMPYNHYCLQQNLYRHILQKYYSINLAAMYLVVLHPDYSTYHCVPVPVMEAEVKIICSRCS